MALQLLDKVESLQDEGAAIKRKFPWSFQGLGAMKGEYEIRLNANATPQCSLYSQERAYSPPRESP